MVDGDVHGLSCRATPTGSWAAGHSSPLRRPVRRSAQPGRARVPGLACARVRAHRRGECGRHARRNGPASRRGLRPPCALARKQRQPRERPRSEGRRPQASQSAHPRRDPCACWNAVPARVWLPWLPVRRSPQRPAPRRRGESAFRSASRSGRRLRCPHAWQGSAPCPWRRRGRCGRCGGHSRPAATARRS